jgi:hypothetical protein
VFEEVLGLPAHPLVVHAAVVLVPAFTVVAVGYALLPRVRGRTEAVLVVLAAAAPLAVGLARESGEAFRRRLTARGALPSELAERVDTHAELSRTLLLLTLALTAVTVGLVVLERSGGHVGDPARSPFQHSAVARLLAVVIGVLAAATTWYAVQTGHSGASMVWEGR